MDKVYTFTDLFKIMEQLRSDQGCPWDRVQTHTSLKRCIVEEAYEVVDGIRILDETGSPDNLCEELGDVLLQVVMHSQIAAEEEFFTIQEVINGICEKMIRRHPHVFGSTHAENAQQVLLNWEEIKKQEKKHIVQDKNPLKEIPHSLPALIRTEKVQKKMDSLYGEHQDREESLQKAEECLQKLRSTDHSEDMDVIFGEMLWQISNAARKSSVHSEEALSGFLEQMIDKSR